MTIKVRPLSTGDQPVDTFSRQVIQQFREMGSGTAGADGTNGTNGTNGLNGGGWTTFLDFNFTTQASQNLVTGGDGNKTIGGVVFAVAGTANCSSYQVVNGTGITFVTSVGGTSKSVIFAVDWPNAFSSFATYNAGIEYEISWQFVRPTAPTIATECWYTTFTDNTASADRVVFGTFNSGGSPQDWFHTAKPNTTNTDVFNSPVATTDDSWIMRVKSGVNVECYSGLYSSGWPTVSRYRGHDQMAVPITGNLKGQWIGTGNAVRTGLVYSTGSSATPSRTITIQRYRIRGRLL